MWYLIVPPIVFIVSLTLFFWFLTKKSHDPAVRGRLGQSDGVPRSRRFFFIKEETGLRILEKLTKRLNLLSLKFHNRFHQFSEKLRTRREKMRRSREVATVAAEKSRFWDRWQRRHGRDVEGVMPASEATLPLASSTDASHPIAVKRMTQDEPKATVLPGKVERIREVGKSFGDSLRSKSEETVRVFRRRATPTGDKRLSEEDLIDRIARNPKDAPAYEELGDFYLENDNLTDAKACYRQVIKLSPLNREVKDKVRRLERRLVQKEKNRG